jgi:hypothetical protein
MTLGEIKAEALKIMVANAELDITGLDITAYKNNPAYASYVYAMTGAINRAFDRLYIMGALKEEVFVTVYTPETTDLHIEKGVPNILLRMIPLFVVGDIYATDEPNMAASCRNQFEENVEEYLKMQNQQQEIVEVVYGA